MSQFGEKTTAAEVVAGLDLTGKTIVITGGSGGLGEHAAKILASVGANIVIAARDVPRTNKVRDEILAEYPQVSVSCVALELADLTSARSAAETILAEHNKIDVLIANAGVMGCDEKKTEQGIEYQFGVNHIGHFLFTCLLVPALQAADNARVVVLSSGAHKFSPVNIDDYNFTEQAYEKWQAYGRAKTANALFAVGLNKRLSSFGITANSVHPGAIATDLSRYLSDEDVAMLTGMFEASGMEYKSVEAGAATEVWSATSPDLAGKGGLYLEDCQIAKPVQPDALGGVMDYALDEAVADQLWELSERLVEQQFSW